MAGKERFHGGHFPKCIVLQAVFWYLRYSLSYRDIEEFMEERGVELDHATVQRWVVKYTPILEVEFRKRKKTVAHHKLELLLRRFRFGTIGEVIAAQQPHAQPQIELGQLVG